MPESLYDRDFQQWIEQTIDQLQSHEFAALDVEHLVEELADLGKSEKNSLVGNLSVLLAHLLKLVVQSDAPEPMKASWYSSVDEHRQRVKRALLDTPSLNRFLPEAIAKGYADARRLAIKEGKRAARGVRQPDEGEYPMTCSFTIAQILDEDCYGEPNQ